MKKLLWIGDAGCESGFARSTHEILKYVQYEWDVHVIGINYRGDPHPYSYPIYPAYVAGCSNFIGSDRLPSIASSVKPDLIVIQNDPWNFPYYEPILRELNIPSVAIVAIDGKNCFGTALNCFDSAIFWTKFALDEARLGGFEKQGTVVPLGVDTSIYCPQDQLEARIKIGLPEELHRVFIVGNANRNQPRKRLDLTIDYFAQWLKDYNIDDGYLFLHISPTGDTGYNCSQLLNYFGIKKRLIRSQPDVWSSIPQSELAVLYNCFDIQITTTQGEGFGLHTLEGMACGIPQIVPQWSALGEWTLGAALQVPCTTIAATPGPSNPIGGIADRNLFIQNLQKLYSDFTLRREYGLKGFELARSPEFQWSTIGLRVNAELKRVYELSVESSSLQAVCRQ